jgi:hypothetical protein
VAFVARQYDNKTIVFRLEQFQVVYTKAKLALENAVEIVTMQASLPPPPEAANTGRSIANLKQFKGTVSGRSSEVITLSVVPV